MVEQRTHKPLVGGSNPPSGTILKEGEVFRRADFHRRWSGSLSARSCRRIIMRLGTNPPSGTTFKESGLTRRADFHLRWSGSLRARSCRRIIMRLGTNPPSGTILKEGEVFRRADFHRRWSGSLSARSCRQRSRVRIVAAQPGKGARSPLGRRLIKSAREAGRPRPANKLKPKPRRAPETDHKKNPASFATQSTAMVSATCRPNTLPTSSTWFSPIVVTSISVHQC